MLKPLTVWITTNWKILQETGIPDHITYLLRNLYAGQETTVRTRHGAMDWLQIGKGVHQGCILSPCLFNVYAEYTMRNAGLDESQYRIKIAGRNINNLRYSDDTNSNGRKWRGTKEPLDEGEKEEWKKLAWNSPFKKLRSWHPASLLDGKPRKSRNSDRLYFLVLQNHCGRWL